MTNQYKKICRFFNLGAWSMDCRSQTITVDDNILSLLHLKKEAFSCERFLKSVIFEHRPQIRQVADAFPNILVPSIHFCLCANDKVFHATVVFDDKASNLQPDTVKGYIRIDPEPSMRSLSDLEIPRYTYLKSSKFQKQHGPDGTGNPEENINPETADSGQSEAEPINRRSGVAEGFPAAAGHARIGYCRWDLITRTGFATDQWYHNIGESPDSDLEGIVEKYRHLHNEDKDALLKAFKKLRRGEIESLQYEMRVQWGNTWKWVLNTVIVTNYAPREGHIEITSVNVDITQYKEIQLQLTEVIRETEALVTQRNTVLDNLSVALIYIDTDYKVRWESTQSLDSLPIGKKYKTGEICYRTVFNRDSPCEQCSFRRMLETGTRQVGQFYDEKSGASVEITVNPIIGHHGDVQGGILQLEDISARLAQQRKIKELNHVMDAILNNIPVSVFVKNPNDDFRYIYWNKAMANFTNIPAEKVFGRTDMEVFPRAMDADKFRRDDLKLLADGNTMEFQEEYVDARGGHRVTNTLKTLIPTDDELPWLLGVSWDITELKNTETELIKAKEKAEESDRLKSMFIANMSHEIRTPLNAIVGFAELLTDNTLSDEDRREYTTVMQKNTKLLLQLISDILDLSRIESRSIRFDLDTIDLHMLCQQIAMSSTVKASAQVPVVFDKTLPEYTILSDEQCVQQILTNLVGNALKFTTEGSVKVGYRLLNDKEIEVFVKDTGTGIPQDKLDAIFGRFVKLNSFVQGTGLGLSICKNLAEQLGGRIGVESEEGVGSRFWFTLPYDGSIQPGQSSG